jgi:hypothetical protein
MFSHERPLPSPRDGRHLLEASAWHHMSSGGSPSERCTGHRRIFPLTALCDKLAFQL